MLGWTYIHPRTGYGRQPERAPRTTLDPSLNGAGQALERLIAGSIGATTVTCRSELDRGAVAQSSSRSAAPPLRHRRRNPPPTHGFRL